MNLSDKDAGILATCETLVCDLDGTLYLENEPISGAIDFVRQVMQSGRQLYYFTNNTSASRRSWLKKLTRLGFPAEDRQLITSADCAETYLKRHGLFPRIYLVGNRDLAGDFASRGFQCLSEKEALADPPAAVVLGFDTELNYDKICTCYDLILQNVPYIATHADILCPVKKNVFKPDVGSFIALFETAAGRRPVVVGKPTQEAVHSISEKSGTAIGKIAFIGDRLYTDVRMAVRSGMVSVLVLSGETNEEMLKQSMDQPQIIVPSVADLLTYIKPWDLK